MKIDRQTDAKVNKGKQNINLLNYDDDDYLKQFYHDQFVAHT